MAVMYRRVILSLFPRRPALTPSPEHTCTPPLRVAVQVSCRAFGSTGMVLCEEKDRTSSTPSEKVKKDEERSPKTAEPTEPRTEGKSSKKDLLKLLGTMKVDVTTKRKNSPAKKQLSVMRSLSRPSEATAHSESLSEDLVAAATAAASTLPNSSQAKSELLQQLRKHESIAPQNNKGDKPNIQKIITDMTVGQRPSVRKNSNPVNQFRYDDDDNQRESGTFLRFRLSRRLNIFPTDGEQETDTDLAAGPSLWDADLASRIASLLNNQPRNGFEEMIQWTREGKLWQYPIDNEAGMDEEASVPFHEHVFLERHLEDGFPQQGPVRHFMELVITGLSKNHQLSVQQKLEHIAWFRDYFQQKQDVLKEAEAY